MPQNRSQKLWDNLPSSPNPLEKKAPLSPQKHKAIPRPIPREAPVTIAALLISPIILCKDAANKPMFPHRTLPKSCDWKIAQETNENARPFE